MDVTSEAPPPPKCPGRTPLLLAHDPLVVTRLDFKGRVQKAWDGAHIKVSLCVTRRLGVGCGVPPG